MRYLLDVNVLVAFALHEHEFHSCVASWMKPHEPGKIFSIATCSITEIGFVRILARVYGYSVADAKTLLRRLKGIPDLDFLFLSDGESAENLPRWVVSHGQVTDGHLRSLVVGHGVKLATLDGKIPGAFLIPR